MPPPIWSSGWLKWLLAIPTGSKPKETYSTSAYIPNAYIVCALNFPQAGNLINTVIIHAVVLQVRLLLATEFFLTISSRV